MRDAEDSLLGEESVVKSEGAALRHARPATREPVTDDCDTTPYGRLTELSSTPSGVGQPPIKGDQFRVPPPRQPEVRRVIRGESRVASDAEEVHGWHRHTLDAEAAGSVECGLDLRG